jgi:diacylglycerol kinase family enzyme
MKVVLIYNVSSGGRYDMRSLRRAFRKHHVTIEYSFSMDQLSSKKLSALIASGVTVAAVGGDGTLNAVARLLVGTPSTLLPLPGGTFNHFVRDLGMSPEFESTLARLSSGRRKKIDVGYVNDELFLNNSNLGLYPFSLIERKATKRIVGKWFAAVLSAFDQLTIFRRHKLVIDGQKVRSPFVFVGNNIYDIQSSLIPQRSEFTGGVLTVMVATSASRRALIRAIFDVLKGDVSHRDDFTLSRRKSMTIYSHRPTLPVSFDGEVKRLSTPLEYKIRPKKLNVWVVKAE